VTRRRLSIILWERASKEIERAGDWWRANRAGSPEALAEEIAKAFELISHQPGVGVRAASRRIRGVRKILLPRVDYFLYYRVLTEKQEVQVLAFWHARRGSRPKL